MNEIKTIADHASNQSDRWLFVALLILAVLAMLMIWRWIVADRDKLANRLTEITDRHIAMTEKVADVVANNTVAFNNLKEVMREHQR